ncbi:hypothetical protein B0J13DRAFT_527284 [Dactylonectria estremocensis]|uniref:Peptidase S8/S53 domain-containing protein n=1 Tax=Dactylonectria estremocensis TaxID=1079267 RepID=A0A9P9IZH2_9HYPO|nr:hypothetical protein B0J13DRAFT_527284 [Dactylonectria estremocensis]
MATGEYPADEEGTISVAQASGHIGLLSIGQEPDLILPGEGFPVKSPFYSPRQETQASGSSLSTALASGVASLIHDGKEDEAAQMGGVEELRRDERSVQGAQGRRDKPGPLS